MVAVSLTLFVIAGVGLTLQLIQLGSTRRHLRELPPARTRAPGISILKPLCGHDDDLEANLALFAALDYPNYELLLGVRSRRDTAWPIAQAAAQRWPGRVRVVLQRGEPGMNPKVNQLITLARAARHHILVVSDSNVAVEPGYLSEIAAHLEDPEVGLVTHPVVGVGELRLGALMDNLHLAGAIGAGMIGAKRVAKKDVVVGKSMALRRADLEALGGFEVVADLLAEDYILGKMVPERLGKRVEMARSPVHNVSRRRSVRDFLDRYRRWGVIHRQAVGPVVYAGELVLNPFALSLVAWCCAPSVMAACTVGAFAGARIAYDAAALKALRGGRAPKLVWLATPAKDLLLAFAWLHGLVRREVDWRSNRLRVLPGTRLQRPRELAAAPVAAQA